MLAFKNTTHSYILPTYYIPFRYSDADYIQTYIDVFSVRFIHFAPYLVRMGISKTSYTEEVDANKKDQLFIFLLSKHLPLEMARAGHSSLAKTIETCQPSHCSHKEVTTYLKLAMDGRYHGSILAQAKPTAPR